MALPARFSLLHSDLNNFLFASVGEEQNGVTLSVVSGLTRLGLDPWEEARPARTPAEGPRGRDARERDCSITHPSNAIVGRFGHQPAVGGTVAAAENSAFAGSEADKCGAEEILGNHDAAGQRCSRRRCSVQHVVIGYRLRCGVAC
jgi:hypothetical protein